MHALFIIPCLSGDVSCEIFLDDSHSWPRWPPVLTDAESNEFVYPGGTFDEDDRVIALAAGEALDLSCVGEGFEDRDLEGLEFATVT